MQIVRYGNKVNKVKFFYDMHIHSDLSPCGSEDMTPNNIVNMSCIKGLDIISVTDHNAADNLPAVMELCNSSGIEFVPGIEVTTREEVHVLCYFKDIFSALKFGDLIYNSLPDIPNTPSIFGQQNIYNSKDEITGTLNKLLISTSSFSLIEIYSLTEQYHGIMIPAHINKKSNGLLGVLGFIPSNISLKFVEVYTKADIDEELIKNLNILKNSDAHYLADISEAENCFELNSLEEVYNYLCIK